MYSTLFSDRPRVTNVAEHHIDVHQAEPIRQSPYRIPQASKQEFDQEIRRMIDMGVVVESSSEWALPVVVVPKTKDGKRDGVRICIDFKSLMHTRYQGLRT